MKLPLKKWKQRWQKLKIVEKVQRAVAYDHSLMEQAFGQWHHKSFRVVYFCFNI
jgi:hypothetical protein